MASRPIRLKPTFVTDSGDPFTTIAFFSMSRMAPPAKCSGPLTVRPSSKLMVVLVSTAAPLTLMPTQSPLAGGGQGASGEGFWLNTESKPGPHTAVPTAAFLRLVKVVPVDVSGPLTVIGPARTLTRSPLFVVSPPSTVRPASSRYPK